MAISLVLNVVVVNKYALVDKIKYKIVRLFNNSDAKSLSKPYSENDNRPIVFYMIDNIMHEVNKSSLDAEKEIPYQLIMQPGSYQFLGNGYSLAKEGLYRFLLPGKVNAQRIVYENDLDALLSAISWIGTHGNSDDNKSNLELYDKALHSKLFITCGNISRWAHYLLSDLNIKSRLVASMTVDDWNTYDNGHSLIEVWRDKWNKWVLYDLDNNSYFMPPEGDMPLSLVEFSKYINKDDYKIIYLSSDTRLDASSFSTPSGYNYSFISENINVNIRDWYRRVMQVPLIYSDTEKRYFFMDSSNKDRIESYSAQYKYIQEAIFIDMFYASN